MKRYLLSTGGSTTKIEVYILDLFKLYMNVYPNEVPGYEGGFDFIITNVRKDELLYTIRNRISNLVDEIRGKFESWLKIDINIESIQVIDEHRVIVTVNVNDFREDIDMDI